MKDDEGIKNNYQCTHKARAEEPSRIKSDGRKKEIKMEANAWRVWSHTPSRFKGE